MTKKALFSGLIEDEYGRPVDSSYIGDEPCYVVNDAGFLRHIPSEEVDRQVLRSMKEQIQGHEDVITDQTIKMLGTDDIFSRAMVMKQLEQIDDQFETLLEVGIPAESLTYMGMVGFRVIVNVHGEVIEIKQPGMIADEGDE